MLPIDIVMRSRRLRVIERTPRQKAKQPVTDLSAPAGGVKGKDGSRSAWWSLRSRCSCLASDLPAACFRVTRASLSMGRGVDAPQQSAGTGSMKARVIFATGSRDAYRLAEDAQSERSMQEWCVFAVADYTIPWTGHELPDAASFDRLLDALEREERPAAEKVAACRARIDAAVTEGIGEVRKLMGAGKLDKARRSVWINAALGPGRPGPNRRSEHALRTLRESAAR
jgi:hypothetical protein